MNQLEQIAVCEPQIAGRELEYVTDAIKTGWISSSGGYVEKFERKFAEYLGVKHAITTTSGTTALHLALVAAGVGPGDEVIIPAFTMIATAAAVCYTGAKPVLVEAEASSWNLDPADVARKVTPRTKAIIPVHVYGHSCDMDALARATAGQRVTVIEDAAEAIGSEYRGRRCGSLGDMACFSFFANKMITTGEGGVVVTNDDELDGKLRYFKNLCFPRKGPRRYLHEDIGFNYRMPNLLAAFGLGQLECVDTYLANRRQNAKAYNALLKGQRGIVTPPEADYTLNSYWMYGILIDDDFGLTRDEVVTALAAAKIETRPFFISMHRQPALIEYGCDTSGAYPVTDELATKGLYLPSGSGLTQAQIERVVSTLLALRR
ncbi:MAG TPA: DegT/DnrJ/EryC1/StrS family aminotransferase [Polyangiaceae bacterium]|nr:DegT/DnrJ/EryC1/StrS family aminotransferase [Polyangiaceae bacterium]